jgi:hypothetical protein
VVVCWLHLTPWHGTNAGQRLPTAARQKDAFHHQVGQKFITASNVWCYRSTVKGVFQGVRTRSATLYAARMLAAAAAAATVWFLT